MRALIRASRTRWHGRSWPWHLTGMVCALVAAAVVPALVRFNTGDVRLASRTAAVHQAEQAVVRTVASVSMTIDHARAALRTAVARRDGAAHAATPSDAEVVLRRVAPEAAPVNPRLAAERGRSGLRLVLEERVADAPLPGTGPILGTVRLPLQAPGGLPHSAIGLADAGGTRLYPMAGTEPDLRRAARTLAAQAKGVGAGHYVVEADQGAAATAVAWTPVPGTQLVAFAAVPVGPTGPGAWPWLLGALSAVLAALVVALVHGARERRRLSEALAQAQRDHEAAIHALAERQSLETLGRLTAGVAHDMGNVLQAVELYLRSIPGSLDDRAATLRLVERARAAARRGAVGARDLLALARGSEQPAEPTDVRPVLGELAEVMQELLGEAYAVRVDVPAQLPRVLAEPGDLEAMLINLATNSRDAMAEAGRGVLSISAAVIGSPDDSTASTDLPGGEWVRIVIADTGVGMAPEVLERALEPFFTTKPRGRGTGLGLALAREFAERSGGLLRIESVPGSGTRASLFLHPASDAGSAAATDASVAQTDVTTLPNRAGPAGNIHASG